VEVVAELGLIKIKITKINKFLKKTILRRKIFNTLNQNIKKGLTNKIHKIIKYQK
jgi:hypothetical protein